MLTSLDVCVSLALPGRYKNSAVARARATFLFWGPAGGCPVVRKHHHRLTRYHYHLQSTSKSWDFNQYLIIYSIKIIKIQLGFNFKLKIRGVIIKMWREAGGICWTPRFWTLAKRFVPLLYLLYLLYLLTLFTLLYFTGSRRTLIQVWNPLLKRNGPEWLRVEAEAGLCWRLMADDRRLMAEAGWLTEGWRRKAEG